MINRLIISAPFGNYLKFKGTTSTVGTYTLKYRAGKLWRLWKVLSTVRYNRRSQSWINKLGLPNPGIVKATFELYNILSICGFDKFEWGELAHHIVNNSIYCPIEFNFSCPNVNHSVSIGETEFAIKILLEKKYTVIAKLPPIRWMEYVYPLIDLGITHFHLCNTIPSPGGGISGKPLKQYSIWAINEIKEKLGNYVTIIGGGGITCIQDIKDYTQAGVDHVAIGSMLFNPFNWSKIQSFVDFLEGFYQTIDNLGDYNVNL